MDIEYVIDKDIIYFTPAENKKEKGKKRRRALWSAEDNLRKMAQDMINGEAGEG
jgi:hypothetical protein